MNNSLVVASAAINIRWADPEENLQALENLMKGMPDEVDLVVVPELFTTGFISDKDVLETIAEEWGDKTIGRLLEMARAYKRAISGSILMGKGGKYYNRGFFVEPSGDYYFYDKAHLFSLSTEAKIMEGGVQPPPVVRYRGWNIAMIVCYDLRFPVWCRNKGKSYDIMLVPANWPQSREYAWRHLLIARAIENQAVYIGTNRSGSDDFGHYDGMNLIVDAYGKPLAESDNNVSGNQCLIARLSYDHLLECRKKLPFQDDADKFIVKQ